MAAILGGVFGLEHPHAAKGVPFHGRNVQYFLSVRCALKALVEARQPKMAWLPSYLCGTMLTPFVSSSVAVRFYPVDEQLRSCDHDWIEMIQPGDLVLVIHYFGFPHTSFPARDVARRGGFVVEDSSQALFLPQQFSETTCVLYSPRKFLGVPDSGIMVADEKTGTESIESQPPPLNWWSAALAVSLARREFDLTGHPDDWFSKFIRVESDFPVGLFRASDLSRALLANTNYDNIRVRRVENYAKLLELIGEFAMFPKLGPDVVPLGFPVQVDTGGRDVVLRRLHSARIFAPVHWQNSHSSHELSESSITLICDQRCTLNDMERQAREFRSALCAG